MNNDTGCLICGADLKYLQESRFMNCSICGDKDESNAQCQEGHFVCNSCHMADGFELIERYCIASDSHKPVEMAMNLMNSKRIKMHGPEHHFLVPAVLITAYHNKLGQRDLISPNLKQARSRAKNVLGGYCGFLGTCGAAIGTGIFMSIILNSNPLMVEEWKQSNMLTADTLKKIALAGGPRCCKRDTFIALESAVNFIREKLNVILPAESIDCTFSALNKECKQTSCKYFINN